MEEGQSFKDKTREKIDSLKSELEQLNLQFHLGMDEAKDEFENQKKALKLWIHDVSQKIDNLNDEGKEQFDKLRSDIENLKVQAALGKAEAEDAIKEEQRNLNIKIKEVQNEAQRIVLSTEGVAKSLADEVGEELEKFHTKFDLFKLQMTLGKTEAEKIWNEKSKEYSVKIHDINTRMNQMANEAEEKWDDFSDEMSSAWKHFKKAFD